MKSESKHFFTWTFDSSAMPVTPWRTWTSSPAMLSGILIGFICRASFFHEVFVAKSKTTYNVIVIVNVTMLVQSDLGLHRNSNILSDHKRVVKSRLCVFFILWCVFKCFWLFYYVAFSSYLCRYRSRFSNQHNYFNNATHCTFVNGNRKLWRI